MNIRDINNHFGDMDLFLMDLILKGKVPEKGRVLDIGCGEGRNGLYFIRNGYEYHGWDTDRSKISLLEYLVNSLTEINAFFEVMDLRSSSKEGLFDLIICSRMLHFAESEVDFKEMWSKLIRLLATGGKIYVAMDSTIDTSINTQIDGGKVVFPDGKMRFALTTNLYKEIKKGLEEI
ncbi:MAG: class I SAM-dependent methyltransferase, partial [Bacteroidota bacterium]